MPLNVEVFSASKLVISKFAGEITERDLDAMIATVPISPGFHPAFAHIIDFTDVISFEVSTDYLRALALRKPVFDAGAWQIVVAPQTNIYGLSRMTQILREPKLPNIAVVKTIEEARQILTRKP